VAGVALDEEGGEEESEGAGGRAGRQSSTRLSDGEEPNDAGRGRVKGGRSDAHRVDFGWLVSGMSRQLADTYTPARNVWLMQCIPWVLGVCNVHHSSSEA
jgi:hypothetical protein